MTSGAKDVPFVSNRTEGSTEGILAERGRGGSGEQIFTQFARATSQWPIQHCHIIHITLAGPPKFCITIVFNLS